MKSWLFSHQQIFSEQLKKTILPHALLINGVSGSGKLELAQWLVNLLNCKQPKSLVENKGEILQGCGQCKSCLLLKKNTFPDHLKLVAQKNSLGIDDIRFANSFLQKTAYLGSFKTVLIEDIQTMTQQAMNALLKTLEEPTDNSIIILLTSDIEALLPTVISRCRVINIRPAVGEGLVQQLKEHNTKGQSNGNDGVENSSLVIDSFVNLTQLPELTDPVINEAFNVFKESYIHFLCFQQGESVLLQSLLNNEHGLRWLEQITVNLHRAQFLAIDKNEHNHILNAEMLNNLYKVIINGCKVLKSYTQANKQFVCEQLIMAISDVVEKNQTALKNNTSL